MIPALNTREREFWDCVEPENIQGCWPWNGAKSTGYGQFWSGGKCWKASHIALWLTGIVVPDGMYACHRCDNPACVNPKHLFVGTPAENCRDKVEKGRQASGERAANACKINREDVPEIRKRIAAGESAKAIASDYGVLADSIHNIRRGRTWAWLQ